MKTKSFAGMRCSVAGALEIIGDRWTLLLLRDLGLGLSRYDDFRKSCGSRWRSTAWSSGRATTSVHPVTNIT